MILFCLMLTGGEPQRQARARFSTDAVATCMVAVGENDLFDTFKHQEASLVQCFTAMRAEFLTRAIMRRPGS